MNLEIQREKYLEYKTRLPKTGKQIIGQYDQKWMVVYQAFHPSISDYAVKHQRFGGDHYSFNRMSWIKPNFLWMMYRAGWASKPNQERILALWVDREKFDYILSQAVHSTFIAEVYQREEHWKKALAESEVRLQWDPDHDPYGNRLERKAIQLGLRGTVLKKFATEWLYQIEDITDWVKLEGAKVQANTIEELTVAYEQIYPLTDHSLAERIGIKSVGKHA
ncbi:DUF4291 domain-containing protein [Rhodocytophaga aerolata]|uniref:DUF4291 domain-containing protein n=1 Tax=Rhodocytophaga aerolata TaxID=455078 RepID=A0ABT8RHV9_9BACT|nr:DUF4291 domain-containing protein [Rhodocytophaga aerolata]MDO1451679.1 DUF4291 domain-containing protein [Rhodocytophaga aerolata]